MPTPPSTPPDPEFVDEIESGDRVRGLLALRTLLAKRLEEGVPARDLAALTRRLMQVMEELEALDAAGNDDDDELTQRRAAVLSAAGSKRAAAGGDTRAAGGRARGRGRA
jgi:hypothetical protein